MVQQEYCACWLLGSWEAWQGGQSKSDLTEPVQHQYVLKNFQTESGIVLPEATIVYGTYGKLDANGDNAVLLPSHYMADMAWL